MAPGFWETEQFREAFAARHMGRISRVYRMHPAHRAVYGRDGISQTLLGQWLGLRQPQISRLPGWGCSRWTWPRAWTQPEVQTVSVTSTAD
ncbi:MAG: hypothetical protein ACRDTE_24030 [Pseudonocardiaceae bacterium]